MSRASRVWCNPLVTTVHVRQCLCAHLISVDGFDFRQSNVSCSHVTHVWRSVISIEGELKSDGPRCHCRL